MRSERKNLNPHFSINRFNRFYTPNPPRCLYQRRPPPHAVFGDALCARRIRCRAERVPRGDPNARSSRPAARRDRSGSFRGAAHAEHPLSTLVPRQVEPHQHRRACQGDLYQPPPHALDHPAGTRRDFSYESLRLALLSPSTVQVPMQDVEIVSRKV